jgi:hypothetical protein
MAADGDVVQEGLDLGEGVGIAFVLGGFPNSVGKRGVEPKCGALHALILPEPCQG